MAKSSTRLAIELRTAITEHIERIRVGLAQYPLAYDGRRSQEVNERVD
jgi:hypothetical protein